MFAPDPGDIAVGTIVAKNFLPAARVLARSIQARHPQVQEGHVERPGPQEFKRLLGVPGLAQLRPLPGPHQLAPHAPDGDIVVDDEQRQRMVLHQPGYTTHICILQMPMGR